MLKKFLYVGTSRLIVAGGQIFLIPIAVMQIGAAGYGLFNLMLQGAQLIRLVALQGVSQVLIRDFKQLETKHGISSLYSAALVILMVSLGLVSLLLIPFSNIVTSTFHLSTEQIWLMLSLGIAVSFFGIKQVLLYNNKLGAYTIWDTVQVLGTTLSLILVGMIIPSPVAYGIAFTVTTLIIALVMHNYSDGSNPKWQVVLEILHEMKDFGLLIMLGEVLAWFLAIAARFQIAAMLNLEQTGIYVAAYQLFVAPATMLGFAVALVIQPSAFASDGKDFRSRMEKASTLLVIFSILYAIPALIFGKQIFAILFRHHAEVSTSFILLLILAGLANSFFYLEIIAGKYARSAKLLLIAQAIAALLMLIGNWFLLPRFGILAAASTSCAAYLIQIIFIRWFINKDYSFSYFSYLAARNILTQILIRSQQSLKRGA
jgi:O-antigen/teichoic acid export membrane protein